MTHFYHDSTVHPRRANTMTSFAAMINNGDIVECPACKAYNALHYLQANMTVDGQRLVNSDGYADGNEPYTDDDILTNWPDVYLIKTTNRFYIYTCANCGADIQIREG